MKLQDFVVNNAIVSELQASDRDGVIGELVDALIQANAAPAEIRDDLVKQLIAREKKGSTGFGKGVAVPHVKHERITKMVAAVGVSQKGVDFKALDKAPVYGVVLLLAPAAKPDAQLHAMEVIFANLQKDQFRRFLRQASTREQVLDILQDADAQRLS